MSKSIQADANQRSELRDGMLHNTHTRELVQTCRSYAVAETRCDPLAAIKFYFLSSDAT